MPSLKRNAANAPDKTGFESYDGPNPPLQSKIYRGKIKVARVREASTGTMGFNLLVEFEADKADKDSAKYNGYPAWCDIWLSDKEPNLAREKAFYRALGVPDSKLEEVNVVHEDLDDGGAIKKVSGINPIGRIVKIDMRTDRYEGEIRLKGDAIYPAKDSGKAAVEEVEDEPEEDDDDLFVEDDEEEEEYDADARAEELTGMTLPALRKLASGDYDIETKGKSKAALVEAILDHESGEEEEEEEEEEESQYKTVAALTLPNVRKWAVENGEYEKEDLKGLSKDEILEMLVDDEILDADEAPF